MTRRPISALWLVLAASLWMTLVGNGALWQRLTELNLLAGSRGLAFGAALWLAIWALLAALLGLFAWRPTLKPTLVLLLFSTALARHFMASYGTLIDPGMLVNAMQTDWREAGALLNWQLLAGVLVLAALPAWLIWRQPVAYGGLQRQLWRNPAFSLAALLALAALVLAMFQPLASASRNNKDLRYLVNPVSSVVSVARLAARPFQHEAGPLQPLGEDAQLALASPTGSAARPRLLLLVLGETARSDHFGLNGYARPTTPALEREQVLSFRNAWSCGTSTAESLPCMFSHLPREEYLRRNGNYETLLDVLQRAGLAVLWLDNQSGCKGVCDRVPNGATDTTAASKLCSGGECLDGAMLEQLDARLAALDPARRARGTVVVLHQMGSHGPAYAHRSPASAKRFLPECTSNALQDCDPEQLRNAYDNSIAYTDQFLGEAIAWLRRNPTGTDNALMYVSDHGESLGENNLYLHGMPYAIAPDVQKHVPWITWLSPGFAQAAALSDSCLRGRADARVSHDDYFHSVLGLMDVSTHIYRIAQDAYAPCRQDANWAGRLPRQAAARQHAVPSGG
ncbi:phosphoethanolamine transferase [Pseudorhodoferax soli]|uniref:Lipid A ethanolaminephosphotransferase n=1 Tax=Pseudorhodoferax soli TaxID=545864 RepID=A0A368XTP3_9BURK|nr:phosphoethanolamine--lipid A transferase [Pseudorhodoferax soli]RCW70418.1 lipid A ethanolaminephosphotransferase [Pseudorhodoferax soli]